MSQDHTTFPPKIRSDFRCYYYMDQGLNKFSPVVYFFCILTDEGGFLCGLVCSPLHVTLISSLHIRQARGPGRGQLTASSQDLHSRYCMNFYSLSTHGAEKAIAPTPVLLAGKSHGRRGLVGCSPWGY